MADETRLDEPDDSAAKEQLLKSMSAADRERLLAGDRIDEVPEEEIRRRLSDLDSGDTLDHEDVAAGLENELRAQLQVIDALSEQREPEGLNVAKVLDSSQVDLSRLMAMRVMEPTRDIIGPRADPARRARIHDEISLPTATAFKMAKNSVLIRIGRVAITASSIVLGIAFYASVKTTALCLEAAGEAQDDQAKSRLVWLISMALLVSVVGICNSMLMSVTERFREIGTMKCLGALDSFIVKLFLIESAVLGFLAGLSGAVLGIGLMYLVNTMRYTFTFGQVAGGLGLVFVNSVVLGTVLSVVAAILPSRTAARMPAAAALRSTV